MDQPETTPLLPYSNDSSISDDRNSKAQQEGSRLVSYQPPTTANTSRASGSDVVNNNNALTATELIVHMHSYQVANQQRMHLILYMGVAMTYFGAVTTLFICNNHNQDYIERKYFLPFHFIEFWGSLVFALADALFFYANTGLLAARVQGEEDNNEDVNDDNDDSFSYNNNNDADGQQQRFALGCFSFDDVTIILVSFNLVTSAIATVLFTICPSVFEVPSHLIEYTSQITVTLVDYIFVLRGTSSSRSSQYWQLVLATVLLSMALLKFFLYSGCIPTAVGGERSSHYVEFIGEMVNSLWSFSFALQQYRKLGRRQDHHGQWLLGKQYESIATTRTTPTTASLVSGRPVRPVEMV